MHCRFCGSEWRIWAIWWVLRWLLLYVNIWAIWWVLRWLLLYVITVPKFAISQSEANFTVLISYDIKSLTWYPSISWSLSSKVMLPYDKLQRGFANKQTTRNLRFSWCFAVKKGAKTFPPKLNWKTLANCGPLGITPGRFCYRNAKFWAEFGYGKYLIVPFWYASAAY